MGTEGPVKPWPDLLTKRKWLEWGMFGVATLGVALGIAAAFHL